MPTAPPTWRSVISRAEPLPASSAGMPPSAASIAGTIARPKPRPATVSHTAVNP